MNLADGSFPSVRGYEYIKLFVFYKRKKFTETPALTRKKEICIIMIQACPVIYCNLLSWLVAMSVGCELVTSVAKQVRNEFFFLFNCFLYIYHYKNRCSICQVLYEHIFLCFEIFSREELFIGRAPLSKGNTMHEILFLLKHSHQI